MRVVTGCTFYFSWMDSGGGAEGAEQHIVFYRNDFNRDERQIINNILAPQPEPRYCKVENLICVQAVKNRHFIDIFSPIYYFLVSNLL